MKKIHIIIIIISIILCLFSCKKDSVKNNIKIGFILATMQEERYQKDKQYFIETAENQKVTVYFDEANNDASVQIQKVETMLTRGINVLVIQPCNVDTAATIVKLAHKDKVPVIAYDRLINNCDLDYYVTPDSYKVGIAQAQYMVDWMERFLGEVKGNIIICKGQSGNSITNEITRGNLSIIQKYPDLNIIIDKYHPGSAPDQALETITSALTKYNNNIQAILCNNSSLARGAVKAIKDAGLSNKVFIAGADADLPNCRMILNSEQTMDVLKDIIILTKKAIEISIKFAQRETVTPDSKIYNGFKDVDVSLTPVEPFDINNLQYVVINREGEPSFHTLEEIYDYIFQ